RRVGRVPLRLRAVEIRGELAHLVFKRREGAHVPDAALLVERRHRFGPHHLAAGGVHCARPAKNRRPALAPPNAVTVTLGWSAPKPSLKVSAKNTRNGGQRSACASSRRVRNTGSAVASAHPIVSPARISWVKSSASGAIMIGAFTRGSG